MRTIQTLIDHPVVPGPRSEKQGVKAMTKPSFLMNLMLTSVSVLLSVQWSARAQTANRSSADFPLGVGNRHVCAVNPADGYLNCWGNNSALGLSMAVIPLNTGPVRVSGIAPSSVSMVASGYAHTCVIVNGAAKCWGYGRTGELGRGVPLTGVGSDDSTSPVQVSGLTSAVTAISAGYSHTCAIASGGVRCWGKGADGRLGNGGVSNSNTPVVATGLTNGVTALATGDAHSCAVRNGSLFCWGSNQYGQLGNGSTTSSNAPVAVPNFQTGVTAVVAGSAHTCAIKNNALYCWGSNQFSQLGNGVPQGGNASISNSPVAVPNFQTGVISVAAGNSHTCVIKSGGEVRCWGRNQAGQLGNGTTVDSAASVQPSGLASGVTALDAGGDVTCALANGAIRCFGDNYSGQASFSTEVFSIRNPAVVAVPGASSVSTKYNHSCALANGGVKCWGRNQAGQLGNGTKIDSSLPVQVSGLTSGVTAITTGIDFSCAIQNGALKCWGVSDQGQNGSGPNPNGSSIPVQVSNLGSGVTAVSAGGYHVCAIQNGGLFCWGSGSYGNLGIGSYTGYNTPQPVIGHNVGVTAVSAGYYHTCAIKNGALKCWGGGSNGELGNGQTQDSLVPVAVSGFSALTSAVATGASQTCAIKNGTPFCWGAFNGVNSHPSPVQFTALGSNVSEISPSAYHSCAIQNSTAKCWGNGAFGQLGNGSVTTSLTVPVQVAGLSSGVSSISAGYSHSCAIHTVNSVPLVKCWGDNSYGQSGQTRNFVVSSPTQVLPLLGSAGSSTTSPATVTQ